MEFYEPPHLYEHLRRDEKLMYMNYAARWLSLKPELTAKVTSDKDLLERLDAFGKAIYKYLPNDEDFNRDRY